jgi:hypothetical protein
VKFDGFGFVPVWRAKYSVAGRDVVTQAASAKALTQRSKKRNISNDQECC